VDHDVPLNLDSPNWRVGYLARALHEHEEDQHERYLDSVDVARRPIRTCSNCGERLARKATP